MIMFGCRKENERLRVEISNLKHDINSYKSKCSEADKKRRIAEEKYKEVSKKNDEIKQIVRDQTDADLLVNAFKAVGMIKEEKKTDHRTEELRLMALRRSAGLQGVAAYKLGPFGQASIFGSFL